ncbi:TonB-dependent receptor [Tenacibaculum sp. SG-28]|uniref:TonB-dependent receptor n=1 Tax=Tenacibaculum sp. SG-28 TaxID=754426 RepID=UPI001E29FB21|nr:TonB-dependent receptor [Tenacibaculum sp. SG-28]
MKKRPFHLKTRMNFPKIYNGKNAVAIIDYRSDMTGAVSEKNYQSGNYESNQTFTEREALALRFRSTLIKRWDNSDKTSFHFVYRNNKMDQIPSYRIRQNRNQGQLTGTGSGEINSNAFRSYMGMIQHKIDFNFSKSSLIFGTTVDFSPQDYMAEKLDVIVDTNTGKNLDYAIRNGDYLLYYQTDILNYAGFAQYEISPIHSFKITGAIRYDGFQYNYDNLIEATAGVSDTQVSYKNWSPKIGFNYSFTNYLGIYGSYANGFTPPQVSSLFRNSNNNNVGDVIFDLKPAKFNNFEIGGYYSIPTKLHVDLALYQLDGRNRLVSMRDDAGNFVQKNAGKTRSLGIELGTTYNLTKNLSIAYNGSFASHKYISFYDNNIDYSDTRMEIAPKYLANITMQYKPLQNLFLALELEQVGEYNTSFEGQAIVGQNSNGEDTFGTATYGGYNILNFRANYTFKSIELWMQMLNINNTLYAVRASYSKWSKENTYSIGNPRAFHFGVKYNL